MLHIVRFAFRDCMFVLNPLSPSLLMLPQQLPSSHALVSMIADGAEICLVPVLECETEDSLLLFVCIQLFHMSSGRRKEGRAKIGV